MASTPGPLYAEAYFQPRGRKVDTSVALCGDVSPEPHDILGLGEDVSA
jgi:hypothetical protein